MQNLFPRSVSSELLSPGTYTVELVAVRPGKARAFDDKLPRTTITFCFKEIGTGAPLNRTVAATTDPRGRLRDFVQQMAGSKQPKPEEIEDARKCTAFIQGLVSKRFKASVVTSANGRFNNIVSIYPAEGRK